MPMKTKLSKLLLSACLLLFTGLICAEAPSGYYTGVDGKNKGALKTAFHQAIKNPKVTSYDGLWEAFKKTDKKPNGKVWDMYSDNPGGTPPYEFTFGTNKCGNYKDEGDCYNREHSFPKSWFHDAKPMYSDIFHLYPTDGKVNGMRSNLAFGNVGAYDWKSENGSLRGRSAMSGYSGTVFEPIDEYKGDFARTYFYMVTCYEDKIGGWNSPHLSGSKYPAFNDWSIKLLLEWSRMDPVSQKEIDRNEAAYGVQKNRNPFIDFPGLEEYIWGDKMDKAFDSTNPGGTTDPSLSINSSSLAFSVSELNNQTSKTINIKGYNLTGDLTVNIVGDNVFTSQATITKAQAENASGYDLQVNYLPLVYGSSSAVLSINGGGLSKSTDISLSGVASETPQTNSNLLANPGFESWTGGKPDSWLLTTTSGATFTQESNVVADGTYALKVSHSGTSGNARLSQKVPVDPNKRYIYAFKYYVDPTSTNTSGLRHWGYWSDVSGAGSFDNSELQMSTDYLDTSVKGQWISFEKEVTSPIGSGMVQPEIRVYKNIVVYIDDVVFADASVLGTDDNITSSETIIYISSGLINIVTSNSNSDIIEVYNTQGQLLVKEKALYGLNQIPVESGQLLIVKVGNKVTKVITH